MITRQPATRGVNSYSGFSRAYCDGLRHFPGLLRGATLLATVGLVIGGRCGAAIAEDESGWPFIRGPNFDGHSAEARLAEGWPESGPPVLWTRELGQGYSSFIAWEDRVATQIQTLGGQFVICLKADSGETLWKYRYGWPYEPAGVYPGPRATPTFADGWVYFAAPNGLIGCLGAEDGRVRWSINVNERFGGEGTGFGYSCSPTVVDDKVLLPVGGTKASLVALNAADGSVEWRSGDDAASYTPAYPISFRGRRCVLGYLQNVLVLHDLETGERIWRRELSSGYDEHSAWPIYADPHLWISSPFHAGSELLEFTDDESSPVRTVWKSPLMSNDILSSVLIDGALYGFDLRDAQAKTHRPSRGQFRCLDFLTGKEHWSTGDAGLPRATKTVRDSGDRIGHASVIAADGKLILCNDTGELILARASTERYEELGRVSVLGGDICWTQPALHRGRLFIRNQSRAACVFLGEPGSLAPELRSKALTVQDIPQSEYVDVAGAILGIEPEYAFDIPSGLWLREWFLISLVGVLGASAMATCAARFLFGKSFGPAGGRWTFWLLAFVLGALGTTFISRWRDDFVFTWPVAIFVAFQAVVTELRLGKQDESYATWRSVLAAAFFVGSCVVYFLLCRRLSLVFEWAFLCGFPAALPFALAGAFCFRDRRWRIGWEFLMTALAFSGFYWFSAAILWFKV